MASLSEKERDIKFNAKFKENSETIEKLQAKLLQDILDLKYTKHELNLSREFINDKVNIFRFLKEKRFDFDIAHADLLSTVQWRIENKINQLDYNVCKEFFEDGFAFYHGTDNSEDHPLLFVRLRYFPRQFREPEKSLSQQLQPFACYLLEMARKYTWDLTKKRISEGHPNPLVWKVKVIVNVAKAPLLPVDGQIISTLGPVLGQRFPGFISSIHVLNFGWMYQGIWSVLKYLLSEKAKSFINFTSVKELDPIVSQDRILKEMGGTNDFIWSMENDKVLQIYGKEPQFDQEAGQEPELPPLSRSRSSSSVSDDDFFDAQDTFQPTVVSLPKEPVVPKTFKFSTPQTTVTVSYHKSSSLATIQTVFRKVFYNLFQLTFGPKKGLVYWILLYIILRGPVEKFIKRILIQSALVKSKRLNSTTVGVTAAVAAIVSTGISGTLEKYRK